MSEVDTNSASPDIKKNERDAARYRKIRDRVSTTTMGIIALSEPRPSEEYGKKIDDIVDRM